MVFLCVGFDLKTLSKSEPVLLLEKGKKNGYKAERRGLNVLGSLNGDQLQGTGQRPGNIPDR